MIPYIKKSKLGILCLAILISQLISANLKGGIVVSNEINIEDDQTHTRANFPHLVIIPQYQEDQGEPWENAGYGTVAQGEKATIDLDIQRENYQLLMAGFPAEMHFDESLRKYFSGRVATTYSDVKDNDCFKIIAEKINDSYELKIVKEE